MTDDVRDAADRLQARVAELESQVKKLREALKECELFLRVYGLDHPNCAALSADCRELLAATEPNRTEGATVNIQTALETARSGGGAEPIQEWHAACEFAARWLADNAANLWVIPPLEWKCTPDGKTWVAHCVFSRLYVSENKWSYCVDEYYDEGSFDCDSLTDGKAKAEGWYRTRITAALRPAIGEVVK